MKKDGVNIRNEVKEFMPMMKENIPNFLTISRVLLTFVVMYLIFTKASLVSVIVIFVIAALTDLFDGRLARKYKWESEFGRKADIIADRFLWIGTAGAFMISYGIVGRLDWYIGIQLFLVMMREIISAPFVLIAFFSGNALPKARYIGKLTTFVQGFALPIVIISTFNHYLLIISIPLSIICGALGIMSALYYLKDIHAPVRKKKR